MQSQMPLSIQITPKFTACYKRLDMLTQVSTENTLKRFSVFLFNISTMSGFMSFITVGLLCMVLVARAVPLKSGHGTKESQSRNLNIRGVETCYNQDATLLPRAIVLSQAALEKSSSIFEIMKTFFANRLSACQATVRYIRK